jgi:hypothetical protein
MRFIAIAGVAIVGALAIAAGTAAGAGSPATQSCAIHLQSLAALTDPGGVEFGTVECPARGLGKGVQHDTFKVTPTSETTGKVRGRFVQYFETGTIRGTFKLTFQATSATTLTFTGTATVTGGTGAYDHARGSAKVTCDSREGITYNDCTAITTLARS